MKAGTILLLLWLAGCAPQSPVVEDMERDAANQSAIDHRRLPALQDIATKACICERTGGNKARDRCWSDFWEEVNEYRNSSVASACGPGSSNFIEFAGSDRVVMTEWGYGACSDAELPTRKAQYERASRQSGC